MDKLQPIAVPYETCPHLLTKEMLEVHPHNIVLGLPAKDRIRHVELAMEEEGDRLFVETDLIGVYLARVIPDLRPFRFAVLRASVLLPQLVHVVQIKYPASGHVLQ